VTSGERSVTAAATGAADGPARLAALIAGYGAYSRPLRRLLNRLMTGIPYDGEGSGAGVGRLVRGVGLPRRTVEEVLAAVADDLVDDQADAAGGQRLRPDRADAYRPLLEAVPSSTTRPGSTTPPGWTSVPPSPPADQLAVYGELRARLAAQIAAAPRPRADLDHVAATATTVLARGVWLRDAYDLTGAHLLCVGDHDLTSLAVASLIPGLRVTVVDVDDDLLDFIGAQAARRGLAIRTLFADLRFGLPPSVVGAADLVFTDPPYTPEGVALFCARGAEGLRDREHGRVLLAYGYSDRAPTLGWKVQRALSDAGFVLEAMLPAFHAYDGAEAIGARADHYVCRPTPHTWRQLERASGPWRAAGEAAQTAIYTRGHAALESSAVPSALTEPAVATLRAAATEAAGLPPGEEPRLVVVADASPPQLAGAGHTRLATVLAKGLPAAGARSMAVLADLTDDPGGWLPRLLLAANTDAVAALVRADHPALVAAAGGPRPARRASPVAGVRAGDAASGSEAWAAPDPAELALLGGQPLLAAKWRALPPRPVPGRSGSAAGRAEPLSVVGYAAIDPSVPGWDERCSSPGAALLVRALLDRAHGRVGNVWREGLVRLARDRAGVSLAKREAGDRVAAALAGSAPPGSAEPPEADAVLAARLVDLPRRSVAAVLAAAARTAGEWDETARSADTARSAGKDGDDTHFGGSGAMNTARAGARPSEEDQP